MFKGLRWDRWDRWDVDCDSRVAQNVSVAAAESKWDNDVLIRAIGRVEKLMDPDVSDPSVMLGAAERLVKLLERRSKLLGLDAPTSAARPEPGTAGQDGPI